MLKKYLFIIAMLVLPNLIWSQTRVGGKVFDPEGGPMAYANVFFPNSTEGTITDENGKFYLESKTRYAAVEFSFTGYKTVTLPLESVNNLDLKITLKENAEALSAVRIYKGKTSKKNNPAIDILRKIWENKRNNGVNQYDQYAFNKYEKLEFDLNSIDSAVIKSRLFKDIQFIFEKIDTSALSGKNYLPIFINEAVSEVYGDNTLNQEREILTGNINSGFSDNHALVDFIKDLYAKYDVYDNYLKFFNKSFVSPLSRTGINVYNYVLADSTYIDNKWSYNIIYYPRRKNELTFKGNFWVNDTTWAIKDIKLEMSKNANINWVNEVYIEQEYEVLDDSTFVISRDHFMVNFALKKDDDARGIYGKRTTMYDDYVFDDKKPESFFSKRRQKFDPKVYQRSEDFWQKQRQERLTKEELGIYEMLDTLKKTRTFKNFYKLGSIIGSGYVNIDNFDYGPLGALFGFNEVEGLRVRVGARTFFSPDDKWRLEGFTAYGFKDQRIKFGLSGKWMVDDISRLKILGGYRQDIEQLGASLTNTTDLLGRSFASSSLITVGDNNSLTNIKLGTLGLEISPVDNFKIRVEGSHRRLEAASPEFDLDYYTDPVLGETSSVVRQTEVTGTIELTPGRKTTNHGVERLTINRRHYGEIILSYSKGIKGVLQSDFTYDRLQFMYRQPLYLGGFGRFTPSLELGKTFGEVPLGLLNPVPGNQTIFTIDHAFPLLNYYEFVTDTYASWTLEHDFGGRLFSYIPLLRDLKLREIVGARGVIGSISEKNQLLNASTSHPILFAPSDKMYWSWSAGVGNILNLIRVDFHFRGNYFSNPEARKFGVTGTIQFDF